MMSEAETTANKSLVQEFYDQVFSRADTSNIDRFMRSDYIQHNPTCADGKTGFLALGPQIDIIEQMWKAFSPATTTAFLTLQFGEGPALQHHLPQELAPPHLFM